MNEDEYLLFNSHILRNTAKIVIKVDGYIYFAPHTLRPILCALRFVTPHFAPPEFIRPHTKRPTQYAPTLCALSLCTSHLCSTNLRPHTLRPHTLRPNTLHPCTLTPHFAPYTNTLIMLQSSCR